jgi:hypothetical protein
LSGTLPSRFLHLLFYLNLHDNELSSRSFTGIGNQQLWPQLLKNSSFSFAIPPEWILHLNRFYLLAITQNQLQGYVPSEMKSSGLSMDPVKWCYDEFSPLNWTYDSPQKCFGRVKCEDCVMYKLMNVSPEKFYAYEDCQINLTLLTRENVTVPLTGFTIDFQVCSHWNGPILQIKSFESH